MWSQHWYTVTFRTNNWLKVQGETRSYSGGIAEGLTEMAVRGWKMINNRRDRSKAIISVGCIVGRSSKGTLPGSVASAFVTLEVRERKEAPATGRVRENTRIVGLTQ
jgi:hypothetical protein